jgi:SAM-dependent methyltransferase
VKLINVGCGAVYHPAWVNFDSAPSAPDVQRLDARGGLPCPDASVDAVYHSHLLEHLDATGAQAFLRECHRVLRVGGILRVAVPDLEGIAQAYLRELAAVDAGGDRTLYEWCRLELTDQAARTRSGGAMADFLRGLTPSQVERVRARAGREVELHLGATLPRARWRRATPGKIWLRLRRNVVGSVAWLLGGSRMGAAWAEGWFRQSGEVHRVMYDRHSLARLLADRGFAEIRQVGAGDSAIPGFAAYGLDAVDGVTRKPDSLFMEAIRR